MCDILKEISLYSLVWKGPGIRRLLGREKQKCIVHGDEHCQLCKKMAVEYCFLQNYEIANDQSLPVYFTDKVPTYVGLQWHHTEEDRNFSTAK